MKQKILLDTDIGTDVDDAIALAYLLANPNCDLLGITTVTGEANKRAMMASALCNIAGKDIPIYPGIEKPLIREQLQTKAQQAKTLGKWKHDAEFPQGEAIEFMRKTIRQNPGEIILLTIGPLTNIGLLFSIDPEIPSLLKGIYTMAGNYNLEAPAYSDVEWNAEGDYHSSYIVYYANAKNHHSVGIDITQRITMKSKEFAEICQHDLLKPVLDFSQVWFEEWDAITFHDPLVAACILNESICKFEKGQVVVELDNKEKMGLTHWHPGEEGGNHLVAVDVNKEKFFEEYLSVFND